MGLGTVRPSIKIYRDDGERLPYMDSHIDLSFPEIKAKLKLDT